MTCNNCIHYDVCEALYQGNGIPKVSPIHCGVFKDKSRYIELPCAVGDVVYNIYGHEVTITEIVILMDRYGPISFKFEGRYKLKNSLCCYNFDDYEFGKTVFLTKEEAEQKLKEKENV